MRKQNSAKEGGPRRDAYFILNDYFLKRPLSPAYCQTQATGEKGLHRWRDAVFTGSDAAGGQLAFVIFGREQHDFHARFEQAAIARCQQYDRDIVRHNHGFLGVMVFHGQGAAIAVNQLAYGAVGHGIDFAVSGFKRVKTFTAAAQAWREDVDFQRFQRAVSLRNGGGADEAVGFDVGNLTFAYAVDFGLVGQFDVQFLALTGGHLDG